MKATPAVRESVMRRDNDQCVRCGTGQPLEFQHRAADGMGGSPIRPTVVEGLAACSICNSGFEHSGQVEALRFGWKVRRWVGDAAAVPVWYAPEQVWCVLVFESRIPISEAEALDMMRDVYGEEEVKRLWELAA